MTTPRTDRRSQAERRARSRGALLEAAARGIAQHGYTRLSLEAVARDAGYTRGALYHQFAGKEDLALAVVRWVNDTWDVEVGGVLATGDDPVDTLVALARHHVIFCRRDVGAVLQVLRAEFSGHDHAVAHALDALIAELTDQCVALVEAGRHQGTIPPGPPVLVTAEAYLGVIEAVGIAVGGQEPHDVEIAERAARGVLGLAPR